ncbi:MAG: diaminopimelate epimerase [Steroidobacteraceae bacterium]
MNFIKMHGLGNDFIVLDAPADQPLPGAAQWRALADRHTGVGFDQALVLQTPRRDGTAVFYRIFNADGSEVEQCGNGARCVARLISTRLNGSAMGRFTMDSPGGLIEAEVLADGRVSVNMGVPDFTPAALPFRAPAQAQLYARTLGAEPVEFGAVSMGNPHAVLRVTDTAVADVARIGAALQQHSDFPRSVNVGFMQIVDPAHIRLRVYERGVGETLACGTGACAAVAVGRSQGLLGSDVQVQLPGGSLELHWAGLGKPVWMTGPAEFAFEGRVEI